MQIIQIGDGEEITVAVAAVMGGLFLAAMGLALGFLVVRRVYRWATSSASGGSQALSPDWTDGGGMFSVRIPVSESRTMHGATYLSDGPMRKSFGRHISKNKGKYDL
jgi:hypothetical protein